jgi:hypothetical protein
VRSASCLLCLSVVLLVMCLLTRVFLLGIKCFLLLVEEDGPLKWPRSRWTRIPPNPVRRQYPPGAWPANAPSKGSKGSGPPEATGPANDTRQCVRSRGHVEMQRLLTRGVM